MEEEKKELILIVDDDYQNLKVLGNILREKNYSTAVATSGYETLEIVKKTIPDLILLDIMMPGIDGIEVCKRLKRRVKTKDVPIIFISAIHKASEKVLAFKAGGVDFITKPFNKDEVFARVETHLRLQKAYQSLKQSKKEAEEANAVKSQFFAKINHEIRTPLNAILMTSRLLLEGKLGATERKRVEILNDSSEILTSLVNDILDFSRIESKRVELEKINFELDHFLSTIINMMETKIRKKYLKIHYKIKKGIPKFYRGDAGRIRQIMVNLLSNSIKFTDSGSITITVEHEPIKRYYSYLKFSVEDTGIGIQKSRLSGLFRPFYQADLSINRKYGGTGLGLAISKELAELMGGKIGVETKWGKGTKFWFTVFVKELLNDEDIQRPEPIKDHKSVEYYFSSKSDKKIRILLVDDHPINHVLTKDMLQAASLQIDSVYDGNEAIEALSTMDYDLVLMDYQMPELNGLETTQLIRDKESPVRNHKIPIVALTAGVRKGDVERCLKAGMNDYILKPVYKEEICKKIEKHIKGLKLETTYYDITEESKKLSSSKDLCDREAIFLRTGGDEELVDKIIDIAKDDIPLDINT